MHKSNSFLLRNVKESFYFNSVYLNFNLFKLKNLLIILLYHHLIEFENIKYVEHYFRNYHKYLGSFFHFPKFLKLINIIFYLLINEVIFHIFMKFNLFIYLFV